MDDEISGLWVLEALTRLGVDVPAVRRDVPDAFDEVLGNQQEVHPDLVNILLDACARSSGDANVGLHLATAMTEDMLGPFGFVLLNAPTVGRLLELAHRYYPLLYRGCELTVSRRSDRIRITYASPCARAFSPRHLDEWTLGYFVRRIRSAVGPEWAPTRASMQYPRPQKPEEVYECFGSKLRFGGEGSSWFEVDEDVANVVFDHADDGVLDIVLKLGERRLEEVLRSPTFVSQARMHLTDLVREGKGSASALASRMLMSVSTLKRRLASEEMTYRTIHDDVIAAFAVKLLRETDLPVETIARRLGYTGSASFGRAFHRIRGVSPTQYRAGAAGK